MSRRLGNLERLCNKLESRFGRSDSFYLLTKTELEKHRSMELTEPEPQDWSKSYSAFIKSARTGNFDKSRH